MTRERQIRAALFLATMGLVMMVAGCLGGCATAPPEVRTVYVDKIVEVRPSIAPSILKCLPEPAPLAPAARQRDLPPYVLSVIAAGRDCRRKLGTVAKRLQGPVVPGKGPTS